eukprot:2138188-Prymnesium_polylepis.1
MNALKTVMAAMNLARTKQGQGFNWMMRDVQMMALLSLLRPEDKLPEGISAEVRKGTLLQMKTGQGKSVITATAAAYKAATGYRFVDCVLPSEVLVKQTQEEEKSFFELL